MLKKIMRRVLLALGLAAAAIAPQAAEAKATPALWSVSDADTTIYLFGTIHLLPESMTGSRRSSKKPSPVLRSSWSKQSSTRRIRCSSSDFS